MIACVIRPVADNPKILKSNTPDAMALVREICSEQWVLGAELVKEDERTSVFSGECAQGPVIVKTMRLDRLKDRASVLVGTTRLIRQWRGWELLDRSGVDSPPCLALVRDGDVETLMMRRVEGRTLLDFIVRQEATAEERVRVGALVAGMLNEMDAANLFNRDTKPDNLIVSPALDRLSVIDTVGVRSSSRPDALARMAATLLIEPLGLGHSVPLTDRMRVLVRMDSVRDRATFWQKVDRIYAARGVPAAKVASPSAADAREQ